MKMYISLSTKVMKTHQKGDHPFFLLAHISTMLENLLSYLYIIPYFSSHCHKYIHLSDSDSN